jgi:hypothetical protein
LALWQTAHAGTLCSRCRCLKDRQLHLEKDDCVCGMSGDNFLAFAGTYCLMMEIIFSNYFNFNVRIFLKKTEDFAGNGKIKLNNKRAKRLIGTMIIHRMNDHRSRFWATRNQCMLPLSPGYSRASAAWTAVRAQNSFLMIAAG